MKFLILFLISSQLFAQTNDELLKRIVALEQRVAKLEGSSSTGLKTIDYQETSLKPQPISDTQETTSPADMEKIQGQVKDLKEKMDERNQYLDELMNE